MKRAMTLSLIALAAVGYASGQNPVTATVSSDSVAVGEIFYITISANGGNVQEPDVRSLSEIGIQLGNPSVQSSTSISSVQGKTTVVQSRVWRYSASALKEGTVTIPRISVVVDGQEYLTQPIALTVARTLSMGKRSPGGGEELTVDDLAFVQSVADKTTAYQGEAVVLRLRLFALDRNQVSVEGPRTLPTPDTEGFYSGQQWQESISEEYAGRAYRVTEFNQVLYPAMPGDLQIGAWTWQGNVRWIDARRMPQGAARMFSANPISITVLPLPTRPEHFSGAVGRFRVQAQLARETLEQGAPVRFTITIAGDGNPNALGAPELPEMSWAHVSGPDVETQQQEKSAEFVKTFSYLITPLEAGNHVIPSIEYTFFAPFLKDYKTERTNEIPAAVQPSSSGNALVAVGGSSEEQRRSIQVYDENMLPIIVDASLLSVQPSIRERRLSPIALLSPLLSAAVVGAVFAAMKHRRRLAGDKGYARRYRAKKRFESAVLDIASAKDPVELLYRAIVGFIADMLNINEAGLTSADVESLLRGCAAEEDLTQMTIRLLRACERTRYAGRDSAPEELDALLNAARTVVNQLQALLTESKT